MPGAPRLRHRDGDNNEDNEIEADNAGDDEDDPDPPPVLSPTAARMARVVLRSV